MRATRVLVLPVPGPATTATAGSSAVTAACCAGLSVSPAGTGIPGCGAAAVFVSVCFLTGFAAGAAAPNSESWPLNCSISAGVSREIVPYSPSKPARRCTSPARRRRMPSATHGPATAPISAMGVSRRMVNSSPSWASIFSYSWAVFFAVGDAPVEAAIASGRGARLSNGLAFSGRKPSGRSASSSTRCSTPMVSFLPHTGHTPPRAAVSAGVRHTPQFRWPSR